MCEEGNIGFFMLQKIKIILSKKIKKGWSKWQAYIVNLQRRVQMASLYKQAQPVQATEGPVLFWVPGGYTLLLQVETALAAALRLRGVQSHAILCDGVYRACIKREVTDRIPVARWQETCKQCKIEASTVLENMGIPYSFIGDYVSETTRDELWQKTAPIKWEALSDLHYNKVNIGKNIQSAIVRHLTGEALEGHEEIIREYAYSAFVSAEASARAFEKISPSRIIMTHGVYAEWGPALQIALLREIPVTGWSKSYLKARFFFRHHQDPARLGTHILSKTAWETCKASPLNSEQNVRLDRYLTNRYHKRIAFNLHELKPYLGDIEGLRQKYIADPSKPVWGVMCHINWDSVKDSAPMAFESFNDWTLFTVNEILNLPNVNWLIKIHPTENRDMRMLGAQRLLDDYYPILPPHVKIIKADEEISPLEFFQLVDGAITVYGTSGLELALLGKPVILAGEAHYGGKGFTYDGWRPETYRDYLQKAATLPPLTEDQRNLARQYAYNYFIQRQIPLEVVNDPSASFWKFLYEQRELLLPGRDPFVDFICEHTLSGKDFVMNEELVALSLGEEPF